MTTEKWIVAALAMAFYIFAAVQVWRISREMRKANDEYRATLDAYSRSSASYTAFRNRIASLDDVGVTHDDSGTGA